MDLKQGVDKLVHPVLAVWNAIGYDVEEGMAACGEQLTNEIAIECCLDADHLLFTGNDPEAHALCRALCIEHGVGRVVETLGQRVTLA
jgi:hypothetical protein